MKNITKIFAIALVALGFSSTAFAQSSATVSTVTAAAKIISPITIDKLTNMNFGIINSNAAAGTVILSDVGVPSYSTVTAAPGGTITAATFTVTGEAGYAYTITLPTTIDLIHSVDNTKKMVVNTFTSNGGTVLPSANFVLGVGAKLNVGPAQLSGTYTSNTFAVTVAYN